MKLRKRKNGVTKIIRVKHKKCTENDFKKRKYNKSLPNKYNFYICLDIEPLKQFFTIKNGYVSSENNEFENIFFEINKCYMNCESDQNIQKLLDVTWFNIYNLSEQISFKNRYSK